MLQFDSSFFEKEDREGFCVESMMKRAWAVELEVLSRVASVCSRHGITYYAVYGTLLGAIRHKGFIPWDDDIDIAVKREDYERLLRLLQKELPQGYYVHSYYTCETHVTPWSAVMNTEHILTDAESIEKFYGCPYICGLDIYPLDYVSRDLEEDEVQLNLYEIIRSVGVQYEKYKETGELAHYLSEVGRLTGVKLRDDETTRSRLFLLAEQICGLYQDSESDDITINSSRIFQKNQNFKFSKEWFVPVEVPFENITISVPAEYDKALKMFYGEDYMTPIQNCSGHEYPFYKKQQIILQEKGGKGWMTLH